MFDTSSQPIAICYLNIVDDNKNVCYLYTDHIVIVRKGKKISFNREDILDINTKHKKLLFPLVAGGILATFFLIASFNFSINIWVSLSLSCIGFILFYLGWQGTSTISIKTSVKEYDVFLNQISKPISHFIKFIKEYIIRNNTEEINFYLPFSNEDWEEVKDLDGLIMREKTYLYSHDQIVLHNIKSYLKINTKKLTSQIQIDTEYNSLTIAPYINGSLNLSALEMINLK